jgi:hypothetical protein
MPLEISPALFAPMQQIVQQTAPFSSAVGTASFRIDQAGAIILTTSQVARPGHIAEREELDAALKVATAERLRLFIERHPTSRYRPEAEAALRRLETIRKP